MRYLWLSFLGCIVALVAASAFDDQGSFVQAGVLHNPPIARDLLLTAPEAAPAQAHESAKTPPFPVGSLPKAQPFSADRSALRWADSVREERADWGPTPTISKGVAIASPNPLSTVLLAPPPPRLLRPDAEPHALASQPKMPPPNGGAIPTETTIVAPPVVALRDAINVFSEPSMTGAPASFTLAAGDSIQPLTRLRSESDFDWLLLERDGSFWWAPAEYFARLALPLPPNAISVPFEIGREPVDRETPLPPNYVPPDLVIVPPAYCLGAKTIQLRREATEAFVEMVQAAEREGLFIRAFSGFRDFEAQRRLYLEAVEKQGPKQNGTAAPGYSEHQLGTTVDVSNLDPQYVLSNRFGETPEGRWLFAHAADYGFVHSYTNENTEEVGYKPEPWHLRYLGRVIAQDILAVRRSNNVSEEAR